jgi:hypothetical protein
MAVPNCELDGSSIVLVGNFNPAIFHPSWLSEHGMLREGDAVKSEIQVVAPEISSFSTQWLSLQVTRDKFQASTSDPRYFDSLRDLVISIFGLLEHTPVRQMGINRDMHFAAAVEQMNKFGEILAPKSIWKEVVENPLMETLVITAKRPDSDGKVFRITIQPSLRVTPGIYIGTNEHFDAEKQQTPHKILELLNRSWDASLDHAKRAAEHLVSKVIN